MFGHAKIDCTKCYTNQSVIWGETTQTLGTESPARWRIENTPATWGSENPEVLVLGFSRGQNQSHARQPFDQVAFSGMRKQLTKILQRLELLKGYEIVDTKIRADEKDFAFGSLIRCSIAQWDSRTERYAKSGGGILTACMKDKASRVVAKNCINRFFSTLPERLRTIVLLGNENKYVNHCRELIAAEVPGIRTINAMAYGNDKLLCVHTVHAKAQGRYIPNWLDGEPNPGSQAEKRALAVAAVQRYRGN